VRSPRAPSSNGGEGVLLRAATEVFGAYFQGDGSEGREKRGDGKGRGIPQSQVE